MELKELETIYGRQMIQKEILDGQIMQVKKQIAEHLNKQAPVEETPVVVEPVKD